MRHPSNINNPSLFQRMSSDDPEEADEHVHALNDEYEGLNYEIIENELHKNDERLPAYQIILFRQSITRWFICFLIGVITALIACLIDFMVSLGSRIKFTLALGYLFNWAAPNKMLFTGLFAWVGINCAFVAVAVSLVVLFAGPVAAGSGIPQIKCYLNGVMIPGVVRLKTLVAKSMGVAFSVAGGLCVGKEGPMIHSGAAVAAGISQGRCVTFPLDFRVFHYFRNDREKRDFVAAGAAAGVAAAFGAPIGGVLFSLEEGASFWNQALTWRMFFSSMVSSFTLSVVLSSVYGNAGLLTWSGLANFGTFASLDYNIWEMILFVIVGVIGGLSGALFNHINYKLTIFRQNFIHHRWQRIAEALFVAAASAVLSFTVIYWLDDCRYMATSSDVPVPVQLWCPDGQYSASAELFFRSPEETVKKLFHAPEGAYCARTLSIFALVCWILSMWTYGVSVPSGLFIPSLLTGAAWGRLFGLAVSLIFPDAPIALNPGKYALAGAAAQLGGTVRMTISLCAIIIEATRGITFGLPIMVILMVAKWVGDIFNEGIYDLHIHLNEVPILGWDAPRPSAHILAKKVMRQPVTCLEPVMRIGHVYDILKHQTHNGYPVVDNIVVDDINDRISLGRLQGLILRSQLIVLLRYRVFMTVREDPTTMVAGSERVTTRHFDYAPRLKLHHVCLNDDDRRCWLDVRPYMHPAPYRVPLEASLTSMYQLMRGLGLRHIVVVDSDNKVRGIVTRKDVARFREVREGKEYRVKEIYISTADT